MSTTPEFPLTGPRFTLRRKLLSVLHKRYLSISTTSGDCHPDPTSTSMKTWHYDHNGTPASCTQSELNEKFRSGQLPASTLVWSEGMPDWRPASEFAELAGESSVATATLPPPVTPQSSVPHTPANPYAAAILAPQAFSRAGGSIPFTPVKRASFGLFLGLTLGPLALIIGSGFMFLALALESADNPSPGDLGISPLGMFELLLIAPFLLGIIYFAILIYRAWRCISACTTPLPPRDPATMTAVCLIPLVSIVGMFFALPGFAKRWEFIRMQNLHTPLPALPPGLFLWACILPLLSWLPVLGMIASLGGIVCSFLAIHGLCKAINAASDYCAQHQRN